MGVMQSGSRGIKHPHGPGSDTTLERGNVTSIWTPWHAIRKQSRHARIPSGGYPVCLNLAKARYFLSQYKDGHNILIPLPPHALLHMSRYSLTGNIRDAAFQRGADLFGVADASCFLRPDYAGNRPQDIMQGVASVVVLGVSVPRGAFSTLPKGRGEYTNTLMAGTATLRLIAFFLARQIEREGYLATLVPTEGSEFGYWYADRATLKADLSLKYAAYHAGLGSFGLNHLLVHPDYGARIRITGILTDALLEAGDPGTIPFLHPRCRECGKCVEVCPVHAIGRDGTIDRERCADYMFRELRGLRCGMCIKVCPL